MKRNVHIIVLRVLRHNERHNILTAFSLEEGRMAFAVPAGSGRGASRMRALLMPLSEVECVADIKPGREVHLMFEPRATRVLHGLHAHPVKNAVALFVAELLGVLLREGAPDRLLYNYVKNSVEALADMDIKRAANFHLCFLYGLGRFLGIEPDLSDYSDGMVFDMVDSRFRLTAPMHSDFLNPEQARGVVALSRMTMWNMHLFRLNRHERNELLEGMLRYYALHYSGLGNLRSLDVVRELF